MGYAIDYVDHDATERDRRNTNFNNQILATLHTFANVGLERRRVFGQIYNNVRVDPEVANEIDLKSELPQVDRWVLEDINYTYLVREDTWVENSNFTVYDLILANPVLLTVYVCILNNPDRYNRSSILNEFINRVSRALSSVYETNSLEKVTKQIAISNALQTNLRVDGIEVTEGVGQQLRYKAAKKIQELINEGEYPFGSGLNAQVRYYEKSKKRDKAPRRN
jgi:hypothetical protein